jgi:hypothetical protein
MPVMRLECATFEAYIVATRPDALQSSRRIQRSSASMNRQDDVAILSGRLSVFDK